jgi:hypothetical protein
MTALPIDIPDRLDEILALFDTVAPTYPDPGLRTPATRQIIRNEHPNRAEAKTKLQAYIYTEVLSLIGEDEPMTGAVESFDAKIGQNYEKRLLRAKAKTKWGKA